MVGISSADEGPLTIIRSKQRIARYFNNLLEQNLKQDVSEKEFRESLPPSCPPTEVSSPRVRVMWRLLRAAAPGLSDFDSQRLRLPKHPYSDECSARSVSLLTSEAACRAVALLPRSKFTHAVQISFDSEAGVWHQDSPNHVNLWPYRETDLMALTGKVAEINA